MDHNKLDQFQLIWDLAFLKMAPLQVLKSLLHNVNLASFNL